MSLLGYSIIWVFLLSYHAAVTVEVGTADSCSTLNTCKECIRDSNLCVWCADNNYNSTRCKSRDSSNNDWCPEQLQNPNSTVEASKIANFSQDAKKIVQIKPQEYNMKLRPGESKKFNFSFQSAQDFPVDLYFLFDASGTMSSIKNTTAEQSEKIYNYIKAMTKNVTLGYGTFVDKPILPFANYSNIVYKETYSFHHHLSLTDDFEKFKKVVRSTPTGQNRDQQEGGFDALAQVIKCKELIDWRNESRKIIVFLTNGPYHSAGDGRAAGIFKPYDGECYYENGEYTKELEMDYPSLGIINKMAVERNIIIFFFVQKDVVEFYEPLKKVIIDSKLQTFSKNMSINDDSVPRTLKKIYEKISNKITLKVQSKHQKNIHISFVPNCMADDTGPECDVEVGKEKYFEGTIKVKKYDGNAKISVDIAVVSIAEKLTLKIDVIENCGCESPDSVENNSTYCNGEQRICGDCVCGTLRYGDKCACKRADVNDAIDDSTCFRPGSAHQCSGQGICECGSCQCKEGYSGKHCECNDRSCPQVDGLLCSGQSHGKCSCGNCICEDGWSGEACGCSTSDCKVNGKKVCNGRGTCKCGECQCEEIAEWDQRSDQDRKTCRVKPCSSCNNLQCAALNDCAQCLRGGDSDCTSCHKEIQTRVVQSIPKEYLNSSEWHICPDIKVEAGCYSKLVYRYDDDNYTLELVVATDVNCGETYFVFGGCLLLALILIGILTLLAWKLLTDARDRKEYKQFLEKSQEGDGKTSNPLYSPPTSHFSNPGFRKRSVY